MSLDKISAAVPFLDLAAPYQELKPLLDACYERVMKKGWYIGGDEVTSFENAFAAYCQTSFCIGAANGLQAIELLLRAYGIGPGDEVIVPANTYIATWLAATAVGATPVPIDPNPHTFNIEATQIKKAVTSKTKAIIPVHLYGQTVDMDPIMTLASERGLIVIEDAAQAHGATYKGRKAGSLGHAAAFSFYPGKNLGAFGDGGAITTSDAKIALYVRELSNYGQKEKYHHEHLGTNSRLDTLQAAFLAVKLKYLNEWNKRRAVIAQQYFESLHDVVMIPTVANYAGPVWHLFVIQTDHRNELQKHLHELNIHTLIHYPVPPHLQPAYKDHGLAANSFPVAEMLSQSILSLPIGPHMTEIQVAKVIGGVRSFFKMKKIA